MSKRKGMSLSTRRALHGYAFVLPFIIGFIFMILSPFLLYIVMGFNEVTAGDSGITLTPVGWENYQNVLFQEPHFLQNLTASLKDLLIEGSCVIIFSFFIATVLNQKFRGRGVVRAIFFLPVIVASGAAALSQNDALSTSALSAITDMSKQAEHMSQFNLTEFLMNLIGLSGTSILEIVTVLTEEFYVIVISSGVQILIFLAGLQGISPSLYEAAHIDGATGWESFWKVTFPIISPLILVNAVYTVVDFMGSSNNQMINTMYEYSMGSSKFGLSSAMGTIYFGLVFLLLGLIFLVVSKFIVYDDR